MTAILTRLKEKDSALHAKFEEIRDNVATPILRRIVEVFPHYTSHDDSHSAGVLAICSWLAGDDLLARLNAPELFVLASAIYLHDIGMAVDSDEKDLILESNEFLAFRNSVEDLADVEALAEFVRRDHHQRSAVYIPPQAPRLARPCCIASSR